MAVEAAGLRGLEVASMRQPILVATALFATAVMFPTSGLGQDGSAPPALVEEQSLSDAGASHFGVAPPADWVVMADGSAWVAVGAAVQQLEDDGTVLATLPIPGETCQAMDVGFDAVWIGACASTSPSLVRIDPVTASIVATIALPVRNIQAESSVAAGEGAVWLVSYGFGAQTLLKIDPASDTVVGQFLIEGSLLSGVRAGYGGVWIADTGSDRVLHVDPSDGHVVGDIAVGKRPRFLAVGEGSVWAMNEGDGTVSRIDPVTDTVTATILVSPAPVEGGDIAVGGGSVWARVSDVLVARVDLVTNEVVARYGPHAGSGSVAADDEAAWITAHDISAVWRLPLE